MSNKGKRYDQEFKADIVRLVREEKRSVASIVTDFGISQQTVRKWSGESKTRENPDKVLITELQAVDTKDLIENLSIIDNNGMLFTILLNEYVKAARKVYPNQPDPCLVAESKELLQFLYTIATKGQGEAVPLAFNREYFKIAVPLAKSDTTHINYNISEMFKNLNSGIDTIYVFGLGRKAHIAKEIAEVARSQDIRIRDIKIHNYMHKSGKSGYGKVRGVCVEVRTVNSSSDEELAESV